MKKLLSLATIGLVGLAMTVSNAKAAPVTSQIVVLERQITHDEHRIHSLEKRRQFLHNYIRHLRHGVPKTVGYLVPTTATASGGRLSADQVAAYARGAGFPESTISTIVGFAQNESGFCPSAVNGYLCNIGGTTHGTAACGLWQIYPCPGPEALDPATNAALAYAKFSASAPGGGIVGLSPWE
jgi:hypothetical protein